MRKLWSFLALPKEISRFEADYLARMNRVAVAFFALHVPAFTLVAWLNGTGAVRAAILTSAVFVGPCIAQIALTNPRARSVVHGVAGMCMGGVLVHFGQGPLQIEMHFYFFALLAMCTVFGNPMVVVAAAATVAQHHVLVWLLLPGSVFNYSASWWVVTVHAGFVVLESVASCFIARSFFDNVIGLDQIVQARTHALDAKNRDMRVLLDNVHQGFVTIDRAGLFGREHSAVLDTWFGVPGGEASWFDYLARVSAAFADRSRLAWGEVEADLMPLEVTLGQMPRELVLKGSHYRFEYRAVGGGQPGNRFLAIVTDETTERLREHAELQRQETLALVEHLLADRSAFQGFVEEATSMVDLLVSRHLKDPGSVKRVIHTLKGNAALYGLRSIATHCETLEAFIAEQGQLPGVAEYAGLKTRWLALNFDVELLLGSRERSLELDLAEYDALLKAACAGESGQLLVDRIRNLRLEATAKRLSHFQEQATRFAERLGKRGTIVAVEDHGLRLDPSRWAGFWSAFVHALRNAVDHGIEPANDRIAAGKSEPATITLRTYQDETGVAVEIADNGRGIDWQLVKTRAEAAGLSSATQVDLERALFADGFTTASDVSDISGRGVGMGALLAATRELGGSLRIESTLNVGTTLRFSFPSAAPQQGPAFAMGAV